MLTVKVNVLSLQMICIKSFHFPPLFSEVTEWFSWYSVSFEMTVA